MEAQSRPVKAGSPGEGLPDGGQGAAGRYSLRSRGKLIYRRAFSAGHRRKRPLTAGGSRENTGTSHSAYIIPEPGYNGKGREGAKMADGVFLVNFFRNRKCSHIVQTSGSANCYT